MRYRIKGILNALAIDGRRLLKRYIAVLLAPALDVLRRDLPVLLQVLLVAENEEWKVLRVFRHALVKEVLSPAIQVVERLSVCDVVDEDAGLGSSVERCS